MTQPKPKQWFGAELPWANYERYIGYVKAHKAEGMTVGKLIVSAVDRYLGQQPKEIESETKAREENPNVDVPKTSRKMDSK